MPEKLSSEIYYKVNTNGKIEYVSDSQVKSNCALAAQITAASGRYRKVLGKFNVFTQDNASRDAYFNS